MTRVIQRGEFITMEAVLPAGEHVQHHRCDRDETQQRGVTSIGAEVDGGLHARIVANAGASVDAAGGLTIVASLILPTRNRRSCRTLKLLDIPRRRLQI
jgi:hypothetical protein